MSLVVQMVDDLQNRREQLSSIDGGLKRRDTAANVSEEFKPELPLFAAAGQLHSQEKRRHKVQWACVAGVLAAIVAGVGWKLSDGSFIDSISHGIDAKNQLALEQHPIPELSDPVKSKQLPDAMISKSELAKAHPSEDKILVQAALVDSATTMPDKPHTSVLAESAPESSAKRELTTLTEAVKSESLSQEATPEQETPAKRQSNLTQSVEQQAVRKKSDRIIRDKELYDRASHLIQSGLEAQALSLLQENVTGEKLDAYPGSSALYAESLISAGEMKLAEQFIVAYRAANPEDKSFVKQHVRLLIAEKEYSKAASLLNRYSVPASIDSDYLALQASIYQQTAEWSLATEAYRQLIQVAPDQAEFWFGLALAQDAGGDSANAAGAYKRALVSGALSPTLREYAHSRLAGL